jgi:hypothetical protein
VAAARPTLATLRLPDRRRAALDRRRGRASALHQRGRNGYKEEDVFFLFYSPDMKDLDVIEMVEI